MPSSPSQQLKGKRRRQCQISTQLCHVFIFRIICPSSLGYSYNSPSQPSCSYPFLFFSFLFFSVSSTLLVPVPTQPTKMPRSRSYLLPPDPNTHADDPAIIAFFVLLIVGGNVLIPIMVVASFVQGNKYSRSPVFMNFCAGWIAYSIGFLLS
jgi:hypothetical protein